MEHTELDEKILQLAKKMILEKGIMETDMKDIAHELGCSRSTLYRHFANKGEILLVLAEEAIRKIIRESEMPADRTFRNGYEAMAWLINRRVEVLLENTDDVTFLRDFDGLYSKEYPDTVRTQAFLEMVDQRQTPLDKEMWNIYQKGIEDGSIRKTQEPQKYLACINHSLLAMATRVLPRKELFIREYGYYEDFLRVQADLILKAIKA